MSPRPRLDPARRPGRFGTFAGVFTPSVLTILGIVLFRRTGYVVGSAGLGGALLVVALASSISILTSLSLSAIATNLRVRRGGDYYLISRTLGAEFGGAIGVVLFLAQSVSIAFYCIGFGEAAAGMAGLEAAWAPQAIAAGAAALLFALAWLGADWATRFQFAVMAILGLALASFFAGGAERFSSARLAEAWAAPEGGPGFWMVFAVFFPAVTGFTQGVSMSGELRDPARSLPRGTFLAIGVSTLVYLAAVVLFAGALPLPELARDYDAMRRTSRFFWLIDAGVVAATLSSGMASFLGAPRILQALASDRIFRFLTPFSAGSGPSDNPRRGVALSGVIALATIGLGELNLIAPVVTMFFLVSYGLLNYATFYEAKARSPSFRPRFRFFNARLSLAGGVVCLLAMLAVDPLAGGVSLVLLFGIVTWIRRTAGPARFTDSTRAHHFSRVRHHLLAMDEDPAHPRDWRPHILAFSDDPGRRRKLLRFASWVEGQSGMTTAVRILVGSGIELGRERAQAVADLREEIHEGGFEAFALAIVAEEPLDGARVLLQSYGVGPLKANTILLNWLEESPWRRDDAREQEYGGYLRRVLALHRNVVVLEAEDQAWIALRHSKPSKRRVDVWWWNDATSRLLLLMAYLMTRTHDWEEATLRVLAVAGAGEDAGAVQQGLAEMLEEVHIDAEAEVVVAPRTNDLVERSRDASLVLTPFRLEGEQPLGPLGGRLEDLLSRLPVTACAIAGEDVRLWSEPDEAQGGDDADAGEARSAADGE